MTRLSPQTRFNRPRLIHLLADLATEEVAEPKTSFAERLSQWLDLSDAIALSGVLNAREMRGSAAAPGPADGLQDELARVRSSLAESIATDGVLNPGKARIKLPTPAPGGAPESAGVAPDFAPYRRYYLAHQRDMDAAIAQLRAKVREALTGASPALTRLAALDKAFEDAMSDRERILFSSIPQLLQPHFQRLHAAQAESSPESWMQPGGWLAGFCHDMRRVLQAELELRLQPVAGLIEAFSNEVTKPQ